MARGDAVWSLLFGCGLTSTRDVEIDTLGGIAIIAMVAGHVIGWSAATGTTVADDSASRHYDVLV